MEWEEFYDRFGDWSESTQGRRISDLQSFGPSEEVCDIACSFLEEKYAPRFLRKALSEGVRFTPEEITELMYLLPAEDHAALLRSHSAPYTEDDIDALEGYVAEELVREIVGEKETDPGWEEEELPVPKKDHLGFLAGFLAVLGLSKLFSKEEDPDS